MTLQEWRDKYYHYQHEYNYYGYVCATPNATDEDRKDREFYREKVAKMNAYENKIIENGIKDFDKSAF